MNGAVTFADETDGAQGLDARRAIQGLAGNNSDPGPSMDIDPVAAATLGSMHNAPVSVDYDPQNIPASDTSAVDNISNEAAREASKRLLAAAAKQPNRQQRTLLPRPPQPFAAPVRSAPPIPIGVANEALREPAPPVQAQPPAGGGDDTMRAMMAMLLNTMQRQATKESKRSAKSSEVSDMDTFIGTAPTLGGGGYTDITEWIGAINEMNKHLIHKENFLTSIRKLMVDETATTYTPQTSTNGGKAGREAVDYLQLWKNATNKSNYRKERREANDKHQLWKSEETRIMAIRSEEHTSELQSPVPISYAVFCLKKKTITNIVTIIR